MKKFASIFVLFLLSFSFAFAQKTVAKDNSIEQRAVKQANNLKKQLLLSAEQFTKVHDLVLANLKQLEVLKEEMKNKQGQEGQVYRKNVLRKLRLGFEQDMKSVLNPQQFEKWKKIRAKKMKTVKHKAADKKKEKIEIVESEDIF